MYILWIVLVLCLIVGLVMLLRKYVPGLKNTEEEVDEAIKVEQEVNRYIVTPVEEVKTDEEEE